MPPICDNHADIMKMLGEFSQDLKNLHRAQDEIKENQQKQLQGYYDNKVLIQQLSKDVNNGLTSKVNSTESHLANIQKQIEELNNFHMKEEIEKAVGLNSWFRNNLNKVLDNMGVIVISVLLFKGLCLIVQIGSLEKFIK